MKKTQFIDAIKNILKRWPSFLSVVLIIALGTGGFFGMISITDGLNIKGSNYYSKNNFKDYDLISNVGVVDEDLKSIEKIEGVEEVEGVINLKGILYHNDLEFNINLVSLTEKISIPELFEGRYPKLIDECAVNIDLAEEAGIKIGDRISIKNAQELEKNPLKKQYYTVTGIIIHPEYMRSRLTWSIVIPLSSFNLDALNNSFTNAYVSVDREESSTSFNNKYYDEIKDVNDRLWDYIDELDSNSKKRIINQSEEEINKQLDILYETLKEANDEIDDNENLLNSELFNAKKQLSDARKQLADAYKQIEDGKKEIADGEAQLNQAKEMYKKLDEMFKQFNKDTIIKYLRDAITYIDDYQKAIDSGNNKQIEEIKKKIDEYLNNDNVKIVIEIIESISGIDANEIINNIKVGSGLDNIKQLIENTIVVVGNNQELFNNLTTDKIISYIDEANRLLENLRKALESDEVVSIAKAKKAIEDFLNKDDTSIIFGIIEAITGYDINEIIENAKNIDITHNIDVVLERIETIKNSGFLDYFTKEGIEEFTSGALNLIKLYKETIKTGIRENIDNARQAIDDFFSEKGSVIVGELIKKYTGYELDDILEKLVLEDTIEMYLEEFDTTIDTLMSDELLDKFSKDNLINIVRQAGQLAQDYKQALLIENADAINNAKVAFDEFVNREEVQAIFRIIKKVNPDIDLNSYVPLIENLDVIASFINISDLAETFIEENENKFDFIDKEKIKETLTDLKNAVHDYADIITSITPGSVEEAKTAIDNILSRDTFELVKMMIEYETGFSIDAFIDLIESDAFVDIAIYILESKIDELLNNEDFNRYMSRDAVYGYVDTIETLLRSLKEAVEDLRFDLIEQIEEELNNFINDENVKFFLDLARYYFGFDLDYYIDFGIKEIANIQVKLKEIKEALKAYDYLRQQIALGEAKLQEGKAQLDNALKEYLNAKKLLASKEKEMLSGEADAREKIAEARSLLSSKEKEALDEIDRIRKEVENKDYHWVVQGRDANPSFIEYKASVRAVSNSNRIFGSLFLAVTSLVCFSTIAIIVEEEKKSVGTTKAFGFYNREVFNKYLVFSLSASILGIILGIILGYILSIIVLNNINDSKMYTLGMFPVTTNYPVILITTLVVTSICVLATLIACLDLLKSPAALLMKGDTIASRDRKLRNKDISGNGNGSLYSRLIFRNMINDKARVFISIVIIASCCFMMGAGFSLRKSFYDMFDRQAIDVMKYDISVNYANVNNDDKQKIIDLFKEKNINYIDTSYKAHLYENNKNVSGLYLLTTSDENIYDYINIIDYQTRERLEIPKEGVLIQSRMKESYGINIGDALTILDNENLGRHNSIVKGNFLNHQGRLVVMSNEAYEKAFNEKVNNNTFFVLLNENTYEEISKELNNISNDLVIEKADNYKLKLKAGLELYDIISVILVLIAVTISFMILTNLSNIYITRKKKELIVMRINGFSIKQTINYLAKETILTTLIGVIIAVIIGFFFTTSIIRALEQPDAQFVRDFSVKSWIIAVVLEVAFSFIINYLVFRKVKHLNFREIQ